MEEWLRRELYDAAREWEEEHPEISEQKLDERVYNAFIAGAEYFLKEYCKKAAW